MQNSNFFRLLKKDPKLPDARLKELSESGPLFIMTQIFAHKETKHFKEYRYSLYKKLVARKKANVLSSAGAYLLGGPGGAPPSPQ